MKKNLAKKVTLSILAGAVLMSSGVVWAAEVNVAPGSGVDGWVEKSADYIYTGNKLYVPGTATTPSASSNKVTISGDVEVDFAGGYSATAKVYDNIVTIKSGGFGADDGVADLTKPAIIYGGVSEAVGTDGTVENNVLIIENGDFLGNIIGGANINGNGNVKNNKITIENATFCGYSDSYTVGLKSSAIYGGVALGDSDTIVEANEITIKDMDIKSNTTSFKGIYGIYGGYVNNGTVKSNKLTIIGGYITVPAIGMSMTIMNCIDPKPNTGIYGGYAETGNAIGNEVNISGGVINAYIYGGYAETGNATGNTVNISGTADLRSAYFYGGASGSAGTVSGNTLNIGTAGNGAGTGWAPNNGRTIGSIKGFDEINIYGVEWNEAQPHMTVTDVELKDTKINAYVSGKQSDVNSKKMTLLDATNITKVASATDYLHSDSKVNLFEGIANVYTGKISVDEDNADIIIELTVDNTGGGNTGGESGGGTTGGESDGETQQPSRNDQVLVLGESRAAAVAFTNQGSELIEIGLNALARDNEKDTKVFAAVYGNHSEYETGSHVNVNGWSGIVGIGKTNADGLTVGAFFENGEGNYSTHNIFTDDYIRGDGEACYNGGGFLVRKDNANGVYAEASLRAGNLQNELRNAVRNGSELTGYDIDTFYYGVHVGVGKVIARGNDGDSLDVYGKFIYTHHDGETFDIGGTVTKFDSVESERLRLGFRLNEVQTNKLSMYYGAAWEYEFNGDAHDKIASFDLETPSLEGNTVIGEIGAHYKASDKWSIDLNGRAYVGQREGFSGSVQANYNF